MNDSRRVEEIRQRCEKALIGPWGIERTCSTNWIGPMRSDGQKVESIVFYNERHLNLKSSVIAQHDANAEFIAHARQDIPWLLEQLLAAKAEQDGKIQALESQVQKLREENESLKCGPDIMSMAICDAEQAREAYLKACSKGAAHSIQLAFQQGDGKESGE